MSDFALWGPGAEYTWWNIAVGAIVNSACAILGCFLVLRRMSMLGDAISHAVLPGIVLAYLFAGRDAADVLRTASLCMLSAKKFGRNRVSIDPLPVPDHPRTA